MLSRALSLATVMLLAGFVTVPAQAQNLEAGKSPSQIFAGGCAVCHKSPRGLLKTVPPGSLPGFLRQHYTTSTDMAASMSAYVISNGAADRRPAGDNLTRQGRELSTEQKPVAAPADEPAPFRRRRDAVERQPEADQPQVEPATRTGRNRRRAVVPTEAPDTAKPAGVAPAADGARPTVEEERPAGRKQRLGKKGRRSQQAPKDDKPAPAAEPAAAPKPETPPAALPAEEAPKSQPRPEAAPLRADPVPPVTPAPKEPEPRTAPAEPAPAPAAPAPTPSAPASVPTPAAPAPTPSAPSSAPAPDVPPATPAAPAAPAAPQ